MADRAIVNGVGGNEFAPADYINRASVTTILDKAVTTYVNEPGASAAASGAGITLVAAPGVTVTGTAEDLLVAPGAADGDIRLSGAAVTGSLTVDAPGATVTLSGESWAEAVLVSEAAEGARVVVEKDARAGAVTAAAPGASVEVSGKVDSVAVAETAENTTVTANRGAAIGSVENAAAGTTVTGAGKVDAVTTSGDNTKVETKGTKVDVAEGAAGTTVGGKELAGGESATTPSGGSSGGSTGGSSGGPVSYTVTWQNAEGAVIKTETVLSGGTVTAPTEGENLPAVEESTQKLTWYVQNGEPFDFSRGITGATALVAVVGLKEFESGNGTAAYPYLIKNEAQLRAVDAIGLTPMHYALIEDIALSDSETYDIGIQKMSGTLDGRGHTLTAPTQRSVSLIYDSIKDLTIKNVKLVQNEHILQVLACVNRKSGEEGNVLLENITVESTPGTIIQAGNNISSFVGYVFNEPDNTLTMKDCVNNAEINVVTYAGVFVGGYLKTKGPVVFDHCVNNGYVTGLNVGLFTGNDTGDPDPALITIRNCENNADLIGTSSCSYFSSYLATTDGTAKPNNAALSASAAGLVTGRGSLSTVNISGLGLAVDGDGHLSVTTDHTTDVSGVARYEVIISSAVSFKRADGSSAGSGYVQLRQTTQDKTTTLPLIRHAVLETQDGLFVDAEEESYLHALYLIEGDTWKLSTTSLVERSASLQAAEVTYIQAEPSYTINVLNAQGRTVGSANISLSQIQGQAFEP